MRLIIKNGFLYDGEAIKGEKLDILIEGGLISDIGSELDPTGCDVIDAEGKAVIPGLVDAHCHLRDPGYEYKEDIETGTKSAAMGGFTSIACMPNTKPVIDNESVIDYIFTRAAESGVVNVYPIGAISKGLEGKELAEIGEMKFAGAVAISDDGNPVSSPSLMKKALQYASMFDIPVISHCEEKELAEDGVMNEGYWSTVLGLKGIPSAVEEIMVSRDVILSEYTGVPIHIAHVSTELSVDIIRNAKKRGVKVTCETCPHYFSLTEEACRDFDTNTKVSPPLRTDRDVAAIIEGLKDGTIDIIATDHAPHHKDEKNVEFNLAANGLIGFETALPLAVTYLVKPGHLKMAELVKKMCINPALMLGLNKGRLELNVPADITIFDPEELFTVDISKFKSKARNSPYNGLKLYGKVLCTIVNGRAVVRRGELF